MSLDFTSSSWTSTIWSDNTETGDDSWSASRPRLLLVDDEVINLEVLASALWNEFSISVATNGAQALQLAAAQPQPALVLLDIVMPGMDGFEVLARLRKDACTAKIPVIFLTALNGWLNERRGLQLGAVDYIHKPLRPDIVRARVDMHLKLHAQRLGGNCHSAALVDREVSTGDRALY